MKRVTKAIVLVDSYTILLLVLSVGRACFYFIFSNFQIKNTQFCYIVVFHPH